MIRGPAVISNYQLLQTVEEHMKTIKKSQKAARIGKTETD